MLILEKELVHPTNKKSGQVKEKASIYELTPFFPSGVLMKGSPTNWTISKIIMMLNYGFLLFHKGNGMRLLK